jgi:AraC-like DNA-binding protein
VLLAAIKYLYALLNTKTAKPVPGDAIMSNFHHWICSNFSSSLTVEEIASILSVSSNELNERCLEKMGVTAKQYILELKLTEAKRLLVFTSDNNAQIAFATGFEDPSYFARIFRKKTGLTPSDYKKKYRK